MISLVLRKAWPIFGLAKKSAIMFSLGKCSIVNILLSISSLMKKYLISMCLVMDLDDLLPMYIIVMVEVLSWFITVVPWLIPRNSITLLSQINLS